ncbi:NIPSNAP family containing protein [Sphingomonas spermidinifaciens]|uniref:NIPSNAP family containing protein n=1 Tax=Sphingomonas spermidinifaciens TaxID=1141889 RepID=A0A2A4B291_9SPHN|nr:NIPSNAP family protein [Sphingomonas spermidinifaciens]PCD01794.1 NIPSNAP family containing protein [Sphingomonas spermidinifaciens]
MMNKIDRRSMLASAASGGAALAAGAVQAQPGDAVAAREIYELRSYRLVNGPMRARLDTYLREAFIPAARRAGCGPIGAFTVAIGPGSPSVHVLVPHRSIEDFVGLPAKLLTDATYAKAGEAFLSTPPEAPPYASLDVKLMRAFPRFSRIEVPRGALGNQARIFELRTYFSHSDRAGATKIEMFDTGGEIEIFRRNGLTPVFFAQDLTGHRLPSLTYLLTFPDHAARDRSWRAFGNDPAWRKLIATPGLTDPEITTGIDNQILVPTTYSQL